MAVIYLKHPIHGSKVACSVQEADHDKTLGWVEFNPNQPVAPVAPVAPDWLAPLPDENKLSPNRRTRKKG